MNEKVKNRLERVYRKGEQIAAEVSYINEDLIPDVNESEDLVTIEMSLDNIERWARETRELVRDTYDEFEEEE